VNSRFTFLSLLLVIAIQHDGAIHALAQHSPRRVQPVEALGQAVRIESVIEATETATGASRTLDQIHELALENNPSLEQARALTWQKWGRYQQAGLRYNPTISYQANEIGDAGKLGLQGFMLSQTFIRGGKLEWQQEVAAQDRLVVEHIVEIQELRVMNGVRSSFFRVLSAQEQLRISKELLEIAEKVEARVAKRVKSELAIPLQELQTKIQTQRAVLKVAELETEVAAAWRQLDAVVGVDELSLQGIQGNIFKPFPNFAWSGVWDHLVSNSPEIRRADQEIDRAQAAYELARVQPIQNVTAGIGAQYNFAENMSVANLQVSIPIPTNNRNQGNITAAEADIIAARRNAERVRLKLKQLLATVFRDYARATVQVANYRDKILPSTEKALRMSEAIFEQEQLPFLQLLSAQQSNTLAQQEYIAAVANLWQTVVRLEGMLVMDGLAAPQ
jgi:cobalt-zinc-cadmium efflux system outer membrane protein